MLMKPLLNAMEKSMLGIWKGKVKVLPSELKEADAAVLGASALGWEAKPQTPTASAVPVTPTPVAPQLPQN